MPRHFSIQSAVPLAARPRVLASSASRYAGAAKDPKTAELPNRVARRSSFARNQTLQVAPTIHQRSRGGLCLIQCAS